MGIGASCWASFESLRELHFSTFEMVEGEGREGSSSSSSPFEERGPIGSVSQRDFFFSTISHNRSPDVYSAPKHWRAGSRFFSRLLISQSPSREGGASSRRLQPRLPLPLLPPSLSPSSSHSVVSMSSPQKEDVPPAILDDQPPPPPSKDVPTPTTADAPLPPPPSSNNESHPQRPPFSSAAALEVEAEDDAPLEEVSLGAPATSATSDSVEREGGGIQVPEMAVFPPSPLAASTFNEVNLGQEHDGEEEIKESALPAPAPSSAPLARASTVPPPPPPSSSSPSTHPSSIAPSQSTTSLHRPASPSASSVAYPAAPNAVGGTSNGGGSQRSSLSILPSTTLSSIHLLTALTTMSQSKDARRSQPLQKALATALEALKAPESHDVPIAQEIILEPLRLACETKSALLQTTALDCISKLVSHSFFHTSSTNAPELADNLTQIITATYTETTPDSVALQIVKSLLALVLSATVPVHHSSLLKAVRTVYNIFLLSTDPINQMVAQGGLTQMVHHVFGRVNVAAAVAAAFEKSASSTNGATTPAGGDPTTPLTAESALAGLGLASMASTVTLENGGTVENGAGEGIERSTTPLVFEDTSVEAAVPSVTSPTASVPNTPISRAGSTLAPGTPPQITLFVHLPLPLLLDRAG